MHIPLSLTQYLDQKRGMVVLTDHEAPYPDFRDGATGS
jgi:hypothetical protein